LLYQKLKIDKVTWRIF